VHPVFIKIKKKLKKLNVFIEGDRKKMSDCKNNALKMLLVTIWWNVIKINRAYKK